MAQRKTSRPTAKRTAPGRAAASAPSGEETADPLGHVLEVLQRGVVLPRDLLQEAMDDAVRRGRMTRADSEDLVASLVTTGRRQAEDLRSEVERLVGRAQKEVESTARTVRKRTAASPVTREVDRARRRIGVGGFPIIGYDDLTAAQIVERIPDLSAPELRKVRDHERRNANRKGVLRAVEKHLES